MNDWVSVDSGDGDGDVCIFIDTCLCVCQVIAGKTLTWSQYRSDNNSVIDTFTIEH